MAEEDRQIVQTGAKWEKEVGYARAHRIGSMIAVSGTTTPLEADEDPAGLSAYEQARRIFDVIDNTLTELGCSRDRVIRTRIFVTNIERDWQAVGRAHTEFFTHSPATTMVEVSRLIAPWMLVEIEAEAVVLAT